MERHNWQLNAELAALVNHSNSTLPATARENEVSRRGRFASDSDRLGKASTLYDGIGVAVRALPAVTAVLHRQKKKWFATCLGLLQ